MTIITTVPAASEARVFGGVQLREIDTTEDLSMIEGLAVPYGVDASIGYFLEQFAPGSLGKSVREAGRALPLNLFHDNRAFPIGSASEWTESNDGLRGVWKLDDSDDAKRAAMLAHKGHLTGLSIEFSPIRSEWTWVEDWNPDLGADGMDRVVRIEARLGAVGLVQTPAYVEAGVTLVRSGDARKRQQGGRRQLDAWRAELETLRAPR